MPIRLLVTILFSVPTLDSETPNDRLPEIKLPAAGWPITLLLAPEVTHTPIMLPIETEVTKPVPILLETTVLFVVPVPEILTPARVLPDMKLPSAMLVHRWCWLSILFDNDAIQRIGQSRIFAPGSADRIPGNPIPSHTLQANSSDLVSEMVLPVVAVPIWLLAAPLRMVTPP